MGLTDAEKVAEWGVEGGSKRLSNVTKFHSKLSLELTLMPDSKDHAPPLDTMPAILIGWLVFCYCNTTPKKKST